MSALSLVFLAGAAAVAFPLIFHLIRRTPQGQQEFSSLMFLDPSPPKLTKRSRLDNWLLFLLRSLAIILLAIAFARPFFRTAADQFGNQEFGRRVMILVDTSASMRRGDVWEQAKKKVEDVLNDLDETDQVSLALFDEEIRPLVSDEVSAESTAEQTQALNLERLREVEPTWSATNLGEVLMWSAEELKRRNDLDQSQPALQTIVVTDLQQGSQLDALQEATWPADVKVAIEPIRPKTTGNARPRLVNVSEEEAQPDDQPRVRVSNSSLSKQDQFTVSWATERGEIGAGITFQVPPGESRVLDVPRKDPTTDRLVLTGDEADFDNIYYVAPRQPERLNILYFGSDASDDPDGLLYYLTRMFAPTEDRIVEVTTIGDDDSISLLPGELPRLIVVAKTISSDRMESLNAYLESGGTVLTILRDERMQTELGGWLDLALSDETTSRKSDYALLTEIDFKHPLFVPFAGPRYNDFTNIRFWKFRSARPQAESDAVVLAKFDDAPALWERQVGEGSHYVFTSSWAPADSQLAVSTKFVPLMERLLELSQGPTLKAVTYVVGQPIPLPVTKDPLRVRLPDGGEQAIDKETRSFDEANEPGIYTLITKDRELPYAVNLADAESETDLMDPARLEGLGVNLGRQATPEEERELARQLRDTELESRQKIWKWLVVAVLVILSVETFLAGRRSHRSAAASVADGEPSDDANTGEPS